MQQINVPLTFDEYQIIRNALESYYYICKDDRDKETMEIVTKLENKLIQILKELL